MTKVQHLPWMPLYRQKLRRSRAWRKARRKPEIGFYMMNLWMASWESEEAGTIENDDELICDLADCDPDRWDEVREDVLEGWVEEGDFLSHAFVKEIAEEAFSISKRQSNTQRQREHRNKSKISATERDMSHLSQDVTENNAYKDKDNNKDSDKTKTPQKHSLRAAGGFLIDVLLKEKTEDELILAAPGWDRAKLKADYNQLVNSGKFSPPKFPDKAFIAWVKTRTKGKPP